MYIYVYVYRRVLHKLKKKHRRNIILIDKRRNGENKKRHNERERERERERGREREGYRVEWHKLQSLLGYKGEYNKGE